MQVMLLLASGHFAADVDVPLDPQPEVVRWGERFFQRPRGDDHKVHYFEVVPYIVHPVAAGSPDAAPLPPTTPRAAPAETEVEPMTSANSGAIANR